MTPIQISIDGSPDSPPPFSWEEWYDSVGGRTIALPEVDRILHTIYHEQHPRFVGPTAPRRVDLGTPEEAARHIKEKAREFGADLVGICEIDPGDLYRARTITERYAIAIGRRMRYRDFQMVPSKESAIECMRIYQELGETAIRLAEHIRSLGYDSIVEHPLGDSDLLHVPIGLKAGFGELGRHGSIINPELGPLFRMGSVATSIPLAIDHPIDAGIAKFCDNCRACRIYCPADAIPDERSPEAGKDHLGNDRYVIDTGRCFPYFAKNNYCSICLPVCVYHHKDWARDFDGFPTRIFPDVDMIPAPPPVDAVPAEHRHEYPRLKRETEEESVARSREPGVKER